MTTQTPLRDPVAVHLTLLFLLAQLSSKDDYAHFFRTIPTELMFGRVMMDFVVNRGWKSIAVFYTGDALGSESKFMKK